MINSVASVLLGKQGVYTVPYSFESDMVKDAAEGKLYAAASSPATIAWYNATHPEQKLTLVHAYENEPELSWTVAVGLRKADDALLAAVNEVMDKLVRDGTIKTVYAKYGVEHRLP